MLKWVILLCLLCSCSGKKDVPADKNINIPDPIAQLVSFKNNVTVKKANHLKWLELSQNYKFFNYDMVKTANKANALIRFKDNSNLRMEENSFVILVGNKTTLHEQVKTVDLNQGIINGELAHLDSKESVFEVRTKSGTLKIRTQPKKLGKFRVNLNQQGRLEVKNNQAKITVISNNLSRELASEETFIVAAGNYKINPQSKLPEVPVKNWGHKLTKAPSPKIISKLPEKGFEIYFPSNGQELSNETIKVKGYLARMEVLLNGQKLKSVKTKFLHKIKLNKGLNILTFQVIDGENITYKVVKVYYK